MLEFQPYLGECLNTTGVSGGHEGIEQGLKPIQARIFKDHGTEVTTPLSSSGHPVLAEAGAFAEAATRRRVGDVLFPARFAYLPWREGTRMMRATREASLLVGCVGLRPTKTFARALLVVPLVGLMLSATAKANAGQTAPSCSYLHQARPDSKYAFTQGSLIALSYAESAWREADAFQAERKAEPNQQTLLIAMMRHIKTGSESYACAEMVLEPYKRSPDQNMIGLTADFVAGIYRQHRRLNDQFLDLLRNLPDLSDQPTKRADTISTIEVERGKLWNDLIKATTLTLLGLVDQSKTSKDGTLQTLVITKAERKELFDRLLRAFPEVKAQGHKAGASDLMFIASLYDQFLAGQYKSADE